MKKKVLAVSLLSIIMCLSLIVGATLALFMSSSDVDIAVTSGKIDVQASVTGLTTYSMGEATTSNGTFANGGTAKIENGSVKLDRMMPGDKVVVRVDIANTSNITYAQRISMQVTGGDEALYRQLLVGISDAITEETQADAQYTYYNKFVGDWSTETVPSQTRYISIELPEYVGNSAQDMECTINFAVEAVQGNAVTEAGTASKVYILTENTNLSDTLTQMKDGETLVLGGSEELWTDVDISFSDTKAITICGYDVGTLTINAPNGSINYYIAHTDIIDSVVVAGNSLHVYGSVGGLTVNSGRAVIESGAAVGTVSAIPNENSEATVEFAENVTVEKLVVDTSANNSSTNLTIEENVVIPSFTVTGSGNVTLENNGTIEESEMTIDTASKLAVALQVGGTVELAGDIEVYADPNVWTDENWAPLIPFMTVTKDTVLNLNGHTISFRKADAATYNYFPLMISVNAGTLTINGEGGTITTEMGDDGAYAVDIKGGAVVVNGGSYYGAPTAFQVEKGSLTVNGGFFDLAPTVKAAVPDFAKYIINCIDDSYKDGTATISVTCGTFVNADPAADPEGAGTSYLAEGYESVPVQEGKDTHYIVQPLWDGETVDTSWYDASSDTYTINGARQLAGLAQLANGGNTFSGKTITLIADINLNGKEWTPIGVSTSRFAGTFDGGNHTISGLMIDSTANNVGLFGYVAGATLKNVKIVNASVTTTGNAAGILVGRIMGGAVENVEVSEESKVSATLYAGGIIGCIISEDVTVKNCINKATVIGSEQVGGIVGTAYNSDGKTEIANCKNYGAISNTGSFGAGVGGIVGFLSGYGSSVDQLAPTVRDCVNYGTITGTNRAGGIAGALGIEGSMGYYGLIATFIGCSNEGTVNGTTTADICGGKVNYGGGPTTNLTVVIYATPDDDLQSIINAALDGTIIYLAEGTYQTALWIEDKDITLIGSGEGTVITGPANYYDYYITNGKEGETWWNCTNVNWGGNDEKVYAIISVVDSTVTIQNLTVQGNMAQLSKENPDNPSDFPFLNRTAEAFVGIGGLDSNLTLSSVTVKDIRPQAIDNGTYHHNFAVFVNSTKGNDRSGETYTLNVTGCTISNTNRGGIYCWAGAYDMSVEGTSITGFDVDEVPRYGFCGIYTYAETATINNCTFINIKQQEGWGGSIWAGGGTVTQADNTFNNADRR